MFTRHPFPCIGLVAALTLAACGDDEPAPGTLAISIYGEAYIEEGLPAEIFSDGWSVTFDKFLVVLGDIRAARGHDDDAPFTTTGFKVWDLGAPSSGAGQVVVTADVEGGTYDHLDYVIRPSADATAGNASADDVTLMTTGGFSVYVTGTARKGDVEKTFAWGFDTQTSYTGCHTAAVVDGGTGRSQLTIHGDHLLYDDLVSETPNVTFETLAAADEDGDGEVTPAELQAFELSTLPNYQVGSYPVHDLWAFVRHQTSTVGHIDGEGHCDATLAN